MDYVDRAIGWMREAAAKADREANAHPNASRAMYSEGTAHGLKEAQRILEEERARENPELKQFTRDGIVEEGQKRALKKAGLIEWSHSAWSLSTKGRELADELGYL